MPQLLDLIGTLVDSRVGIIANVQEVPRDQGAPDFVYMTAKTCKLNMANGSHEQEFFIGTGVAVDRSHAIAKAVGEAIERYCAAECVPGKFPLAAFESADFPCVRPEKFVLFSDVQYAKHDFPYVPFTRASKVHWAAGLDLRSGETIFVPATMVFLSPHQFQEGASITQQISTGLASHCDTTLAALKAVCEVIERDAIAVTWLAMLPQPKILLNTLSLKNQELVARLERPGVSVTLLYLKMDHGIPVIFSIMQNQTRDGPAIVVAAAADLDPEAAVRRSLEELGQIWYFAQIVRLRQPKFLAGKQWVNVRDMESHAIFYFSHKNKRYMNFLLNSSRTISFREIPSYARETATESLHALVQAVTATKHRIVLIDITSQDTRELGLWVFRAVIPGFHPLFMGHRFRALGRARLVEVCERLGFPSPRYDKALNPAPHPFS